MLTETRGNVLIVTLNRPEVRNAVNQAVADGVGAALDWLDEDPVLTVAVLTGVGKGFCAGMDLRAFVEGERSVHATRGFGGIVQRPPDKPVIAAIEGFAVAGGLEIALACDLLVAARGALLGIPEVKRSIIAAGGGLLHLPRRLPAGVASEMALTGDPITAERAASLGLVNRLADPGQAIKVALELADRIAENGPLAVRATKKILTAQWDWSTAAFFDEQQALSEPVQISDDAREGATAFVERRPPVWRGR